MSHPALAGVVVAVLGCLAVGCSAESPVRPDTQPGGAASLAAKPGAGSPGVYELEFYKFGPGGPAQVSSMPVLSGELILAAHVTSSTGSLATAGSVTFEYCSYKGGPPNDITRADEAPKEACETGSATWARLTSVKLTSVGCPGFGPGFPPGYACMNFGVVRIPRDVGFRFRYATQVAGLASGASVPLNFTWTAQ